MKRLLKIKSCFPIFHFHIAYVFILILFSSLTSITINAQQIAFPTAEGAGRFTTGGRGTPLSPTTVYEVTSLDDATDNTIGTLRWAIRNNNPVATHRTIVFRVSGTIRLNSPLTINRANTTIAGQTAPGDGICIADYPVTLSADNVIIRYIRFRLGDRYQQARKGSDDAFSGTGRKNIIIDHCTMSWSNDEAFTIYAGDSTTLQWNMIYEPLNYSYHDEGSGIQQHGYAGIWGGRRSSLHHNLLAHALGRMPRFDGSRNLPNSSSPVVGSENADYRNNVIYNWGSYNVNGGEGGNYNVVNNFYKYGPNTPSTTTVGVNRRFMVINPFKQSSPALPYGKFYLAGNFVDGSTTVTENNWRGAAMSGGTQADTIQAKVESPFSIAPLNTETALQAYESVLQGAGVILPKRDTLDQRVANDVRNRTGRIIDVQGGYPWGTPFSTSQSAWPTLNSLPAPTDSDKDGMPDVWESRRGLNPNNAADRNFYTANGYSNIENYLNGDSIVAMGVANSCITGKSISTATTGKWIHATDTTYSHVIATDTLNAIASVLDNGNYGRFNVSYFTTSTTRTINGHAYLNRNVTIEALDAASVTGPVTVRLYISQQEFATLQAADNSIATPADLRIVKVNDNNCSNTFSGNYSVITPTATGVFGTYNNGYFIEFATSSFSTFYITGPSIALPLKLVAFTGSYNGSATKLDWRTVNEINTEAFIVERSTNGQTFTTIDRVVAKGRNDNSYSYTDNNAVESVNYYRLKMTDKDGKFTYSNVLAFNSTSTSRLTITPNPAASNITVSHEKAIKGTQLKVVSITGKVLFEIAVQPGALQTNIGVAELAAGSYILVLSNEKEVESKQFIKK